MKNTWLLILFAFCLWSCDNDDDNNRYNQRFIGDWFVYDIFFNNQPQNLNNCDRENAFFIYPDGTFEEVGVFTDNNGNCQIDYEAFGIWDSLGNNRYVLMYEPDFNGFVYEETVRVEDNSFFISFNDSSVWYYGKE